MPDDFFAPPAELDLAFADFDTEVFLAPLPFLTGAGCSPPDGAEARVPGLLTEGALGVGVGVTVSAMIFCPRPVAADPSDADREASIS